MEIRNLFDITFSSMTQHSDLLSTDPIADIADISNSDFIDLVQLAILRSPTIQ